MHLVRVTSWRPGLCKLSLTKTIMRCTGDELFVAEFLMDQLLDGAPIALRLLPEADPDTVVAELMAAGAVASYDARDKRDKMDSARLYLLLHGYPTGFIQHGLEGFLDGWWQVVVSVAKGEAQDPDEYLNDVDRRHSLHQMLPHLDARQSRLATDQLAQADSRIRPHLVPTTVCLWGEEIAAEDGYERETHWWFFHRPSVVDESWRDF